MAVYLDAAQAGRHRARHEPRARRPPDARPPAEFLGQALHDRSLRRAQGRRAHRLRRARAARRRAQAEDDHRRRQRLSARHRLRAHPRGRRSRRRARCSPTWRTSPAWSPPASTRARCRTPTSSRRRRTRRCAGRAAGMVLCREQYAKDLDRSRVPRRAGRPADAHHRGQGGVLQGSGASRRSRDYQRQIVANAKRLARGARGRRLPPGQRRHRQPPDARRRLLARASPARWPKRRSARPASRSTRTRFRSIRTRRWSPAASASARPP